MKRLTILSLALAAFTAFTSLATADTRGLNDHPARRARIRHGVTSGQLTRHEAARLRAGQLQIRRLERMALADGRMSPRELAMIQRVKMQQSRAIFRMKHNGRVA